MYVQGARNLYLTEKFYRPTILSPNLKGVKIHIKTYNSYIFSVTNKFITVDSVICLSRVLGNLARSVLRGEGSSDAPALPDFILKPGESASELLNKIEEFLSERGMNVSQKKTKVTATTDGFDFLGWHFYVQKNNEKFRSKPSMENFKAFRKKVKQVVNNSNYGAKVKVKKLAPIVRGWRNYHKYCKMDGSRFRLWDLAQRTYKVFLKQKSINRYQAEQLVKQAFPAVGYSENKFVNVKGEKSPFDGDLNYWAKRKNALYDGATTKALRKQNHTCGACGLKFASDERVELHHMDGNHNNWKPNNLQAVHRSCHHYLHMGKTY